MPRKNFGPTVKKRAKYLVKLLLNYAVDYPFNKKGISNLELRWEEELDNNNSVKLVVKTKVIALEHLTKTGGEPLNKTYIIEVLKTLKSLNFLIDNRVKRQGKEDWLFTLNLWSRDQEKNLELLDTEWEKQKLNQGKIQVYQDWADAPFHPNFYGREIELSLLKQWVIEDQCCLVGILGISGVGKTTLSIKLGKGGIGKTDLSLKLAQEIQDEFEYIVWRSLRNAPLLTTLIADLLKFLSNQQEINLENSLEEQFSKLVEHLRSHRCLLILDNVETILQTGPEGQEYRPGYGEYSELFQLIALSSHQSCLILTSREKPENLARLAGQNKPVRFLELKGLDYLNGKKIFTDIENFTGTDAEWQKIIEFYDGNPLALELAAHHIKDCYGNNISVFLQQGKPIFEHLNHLLNWHFERLKENEKEVLYWLAINRKPVSIIDLKEDLITVETQNNLASIIQSIQNKFSLERNQNKQELKFTLQPVLMEFITENFINNFCQNLTSTEVNFEFCNKYILVKSQAKDYIKFTQNCLILKPIVESLIIKFQGQKNLENFLKHIKEQIQARMPLQIGYMASNILNLFNELKTDLRGYDFSNLTIWQADLQQMHLVGVNFTNSDLSKSTFPQIFSNIITVAVSPDGKFLATGDAKGEILLWDLVNRQQIFTFKGHTNYVNKIQFNTNSNKMASCSSDYTIKLWDVTTGRCLKTLRGHKNRVSDLAFSRDEQILVSGSGDGTIKLWDMNQNTIIQTLPMKSGIRKVIFHPSEENILIIAHENGTIQQWDLAENKCIMHILAHSGPIFSLVLSHDYQTLVSGSGDFTIKFWNINSGKSLKVLSGHTGAILDLAFSDESKILASASDDKTIRLWHFDTWENFQTLMGHTGKVQSIVFSQDNQILISGSNDRTVKLWEIQNGNCALTLSGYTNSHTSIAFNPNAQILASGANDGRLRLWWVTSGQCFKTLKGHDSQIEALAFSPNGQILASGDANGMIKIWDIKTYECLQNLSGYPDEHTNTVWMITFSDDNLILASASADCTVKIWEVLSGECLNTFKHSSGVWSVAISPDRETLISSCHDGTVSLWNLNSGKKIKTLKVHKGQVFTLVFSQDKKTLISAGNDSTVKLLDAKTGKCIKSIKGFDDEVLAVAEKNAQILVSDSSLNRPEIKIRDLMTGKWLSPLIGHTKGIWSIIFSIDGEKAASTSHDETIRIWDIETGNCLQVLKVEKLYENMNITNIKGLTEAQKVNLKAMGAVENFCR
ncbi:NB-ARC domain-containing protein [Gloeothece verrucosa]|uniref:WD40 repeat, subgroup n=1 Tax=Gloeothece verrucosa (strain PCC 7822) TaxID=497965 RepID=E0UL31_GLOV7|nr:NB-ARC domain-containing protein [Gloeothece verrucosa]ADN17661.1 WD40 repeat, subgroup [Gloeothece verrucosa PCC 7822]